DKLRLEFETATSHERIHRAFVPRSPGEKRDLIYGHKEARTIHFTGQPLRESCAIRCETRDKLRLKDVEMVGPPEVAEVPEYMRISGASVQNDRSHTGEIIFTRRDFHQMPTDPFASEAHPLLPQTSVIQLGKSVVGAGGDEVEPLSGAANVSGTFKTAPEEAFEQRHPRNDHGRRH